MPETRNSGMTETRKTSPGILKPGITFLRRQKLEQFWVVRSENENIQVISA